MPLYDLTRARMMYLSILIQMYKWKYVYIKREVSVNVKWSKLIKRKKYFYVRHECLLFA